MDYEMIHQIQGVFTKEGTPAEVNDRIASAFEAVTKSAAYNEYIEQNVHVVPSFSGDIEANTARFRKLLETMKSALTNAGLI